MTYDIWMCDKSRYVAYRRSFTGHSCINCTLVSERCMINPCWLMIIKPIKTQWRLPYISSKNLNWFTSAFVVLIVLRGPEPRLSEEKCVWNVKITSASNNSSFNSMTPLRTVANAELFSPLFSLVISSDLYNLSPLKIGDP